MDELAMFIHKYEFHKSLKDWDKTKKKGIHIANLEVSKLSKQ